MSAGNDTVDAPKSMRHKQILDAAAENPDASLDELASMVPSATSDLAERVLDEYGDPAADDDEENDEEESTAESDSSNGKTPDHEETVADSQADDESAPADDGGASATADAAGESDTARTATVQEPEDTTADDPDRSNPSKDELTEKQLDVLTYIAAHPNATQREIGEELDVSSATVNNRVNSIDGFEWSERQGFVESLFEYRGSAASGDNNEPPSASAQQSTIGELATRLESLEERVAAECGGSASSESAFDDTELVHKVVHACMESDRISEEEELCILREILE